MLAVHFRARRGFVPVLLSLAAVSCERPQGAGASDLTLQRSTIGDTVVVRNLSGSLWGDTVRLVEELRIGDREGGDAYTFGDVRAMAVGLDGTAYVYDASMRALRSYDTAGHYVRTIGRDGAGPGEYRDVVGLAISRNGRLFLRDPRLGRIVQFTAEGEPAGTWQLLSGLYGDDALMFDTTGNVYAKVVTGAIKPGAPWPLGFVKLDANGVIVDTVESPRWAEAPVIFVPYGPEVLWTRHPFGFEVTAFGARYAIELRRPDGSVLRLERAGFPALKIPDAERRELSAIVAAEQREPDEVNSAPPGTIPFVKPAIRALKTGADGRLWVRPYMPSVENTAPVDTTLPLTQRSRRWSERVAWDVFEPDGRFLGRLLLPERATIHVMRGEYVWGTMLEQDDVPYVIRWHIVGVSRRQ